MDDLKKLTGKKKTEQKERHAARKTRGSKKIQLSDNDNSSVETDTTDVFISTITYDDDIPTGSMTVDFVAEEEKRQQDEADQQRKDLEAELLKTSPKKKIKKNLGDVKKKMISTTTLIFLDSKGNREEIEPNPLQCSSSKTNVVKRSFQSHFYHRVNSWCERYC